MMKYYLSIRNVSWETLWADVCNCSQKWTVSACVQPLAFGDAPGATWPPSLSWLAVGQDLPVKISGPSLPFFPSIWNQSDKDGNCDLSDASGTEAILCVCLIRNLISEPKLACDNRTTMCLCDNLCGQPYSVITYLFWPAYPK